MEALPLEDVRSIVHLLGEVAVLATDLPGKRRFLMTGLSKLIHADMWAWVHFKDEGIGGIPIRITFLDGGWQSETQRLKFTEATVSPAAAAFNKSMRVGSEKHITRRRADAIADNAWFASDLLRKHLEAIDIGEFLSSQYPLGGNIFSSLAFLRVPGRQAFSPREVCIAHIITEEIDWLHRQETNAPAAEHAGDLSVRQRQVLLHLIAGDSVKTIARKLSISTYTVNDHIKNIYRRFGVNGRGELLAQFLAGGPALGHGSGDAR